MVDFQPLRALRFEEARSDPLAQLISPPYDVLSDEQVGELCNRSPCNVIRLEHPTVALASFGGPYAAAARLLSQWTSEGVLGRDGEPRYYLHEQYFAEDGGERCRRVVYGRLRLVSWEAGEVLPHEYTMAGPKEDRLRLLEALNLNTSPLHLLYEDAKGDIAGLLDSFEGTPALAEADVDGQRHVLHAIADEATVEGLGERFAGLRLYMADGHHRYETALHYAGLTSGGARYVLAGLTAGDDRGLSIHATHRLFSGEAPAGLLARLEGDFTVSVTSPAELRQALAGAEVAFGVAGAGPTSLHLLRPHDLGALATRVPERGPGEWRALDVNLLHHAILGPHLGLDPEEPNQPGLSYVHSVDEALEAVASGRVRLAFLLRPVSVEQLFAVSDAGARMPQKSTYFFPKLPAGLVMNPLD